MEEKCYVFQSEELILWSFYACCHNIKKHCLCTGCDQNESIKNS